MKRLTAGIALLMLTALSGCSLIGSGNSPTTSPALPEVSKVEFNRSLKNLVKKCDEFDGTCSYSVNPDKLMQYMTKVESDLATVILFINQSETGEATLALSPVFTGEEWLFFDQLDLKCRGKTKTYEFSYADTTTEIRDDGGVIEAGNKILRSEELPYLDTCARDAKAKFRLSGSKSTFTGALNKKARKLLESSLVVYRGLNQGF